MVRRLTFDADRDAVQDADGLAVRGEVVIEFLRTIERLVVEELSAASPELLSHGRCLAECCRVTNGSA